MGDSGEDINSAFGRLSPKGLPKDVLGELQSIANLHSLSPQDLFVKWECYCVKMGAEDAAPDLEAARALKADILEEAEVERNSRRTRHPQEQDKEHGTPAGGSRAFSRSHDAYGELDSMVLGTPQPRSAKRKNNFETPKAPQTAKSSNFRSPNNDSIKPIPFSERQNSGQVLESLNAHLPPAQAPIAPFSEPRVSLTANTDIQKFAYKPMAMHLSEASEVLDDRIDEFVAILQKHYGLESDEFGSAASQSTKEIVAVGRIATDSLDGKLNNASLVLETSRRKGAGLRVPLKLDSVPSARFFPGQIVGLRGINASQKYFSVLEILEPPLLPNTASSPGQINSRNDRLEAIGSAELPLNVMVASGPYTADDNLDFEPLQSICSRATEECVDALVLTGPFIDVEHPLIASGDFDLPETDDIDPNTATLSTLFQYSISPPLKQLAAAVPSTTIILMPSVRDAVSHHVSWPQEMLTKVELGLPTQAKVVSNPVMLSLNESLFGLSSHDVLHDLRQNELLHGKPSDGSLLTRLPRYLIEQRHFLPVFPPSSRENFPKSGLESGLATGAMLDVSYLKLGEWRNVLPDVLVVPSSLPPFVKVVDNVLVINPGTLSKRRGAGTFARMALHPRKLSEAEQESDYVNHNVYERAKVDIIRI